MQKLMSVTVFLFLLLVGCQNHNQAQRQSDVETSQTAVASKTADLKKNKENKILEESAIPKVMVPLTHEETGEVRMVEATVKTVEQKQFFVPNAQNGRSFSWSSVYLSKSDGGKYVPNTENKVFLIEYWSTDSLKNNKYWNQARQLEHEKNADEFEVISIHFDTTKPGKFQIKSAEKALASYTRPRNLSFDFMDSFRDDYQVAGQATYYLVDIRGQVIGFGRHDQLETQAIVFDKIRDALLHRHAVKTGGMQVMEVVK